MGIKTVTTDELRQMTEKEGLVIQGCGGDLQEWVDAINTVLTEEKILLSGSKFENENIRTFQDGIKTCLLFMFNNRIDMNINKLAMWRLQTHGSYGSTWLSDYISNMPVQNISSKKRHENPVKPDCPLIGQDGNIFNLMGIASRTLKENGMETEAKEMCKRIRESGNYYKALNIIGEYVTITSARDSEDPEETEEPDFELH